MMATSNDKTTTMIASNDKTYDFIVFGVTGFTGKLVVEYLLKSGYACKWAASARNADKANAVLKDIADDCGKEPPTLFTADLVCETPEQEEILRQVVKQTKIILTTAGPFEKYGTTLVKLCAEEGVGYCDITGETDFVRKMISEHDKTARETGAVIISHCGNDCVPQDLTVLEMYQFAKKQQASLKQVSTHVEFPESASMSGGTAATAAYQLGKDRKNQPKPAFDPLLQAQDGSKSEFVTKNISPKSTEYQKDLDCHVGPWIMAPVMVNCVRRSNALLQYSKEFEYGDSQIQNRSWTAKLQETGFAATLGAAILFPSMKRFLPQPGEGPDRQTMEEGWMTCHGRGVIVDKDGKEVNVTSKFHFSRDVGYLYTAAMLVEAGMVLLEKLGTIDGGVVTPAVALGSHYMQRILKTMDTSFEIKLEELQVV